MDFVLAFVLSFGPAFGCALILYWLDRYEKEPTILLGAVFTWGAMVAVAAAIATQAALSGAESMGGSDAATQVAQANVVVPLVEESLKGIALLVVFLFLRRQFSTVRDGLVYGAVCALGFAAAENALILLGTSAEQGISGLIADFQGRILVQLVEAPFYTAVLGMSLAVAAFSGSFFLRWLAPPLGWAAAVGLHALRKILASRQEKDPSAGLLYSLMTWGAWLGFALLVAAAVSRERRLLRRHLEEEVEAGRISEEQAQLATSLWKRTVARFGALTLGSDRVVGRLYEVCSLLAHQKEQLARLGDDEEETRSARIAELRGEMAALSAQLAEGEASLVPPPGSG